LFFDLVDSVNIDVIVFLAKLEIVLLSFEFEWRYEHISFFLDFFIERDKKVDIDSVMDGIRAKIFYGDTCLLVVQFELVVVEKFFELSGISAD